MLTLRASVLALGLLMVAQDPLAARQLDGASPILCALNEALECTPGQECRPVLLEEVGAPNFLLVDVAAKSVQGVGLGTRTSAIRSVASIDGKLILQGAENGLEGVRDGLGWSAAISHDSGHLVLSASGDRVAFVVFGSCLALANRKVAPE